MCFKRKDMIVTKGGPGGAQYWCINTIDFLSDLKQMILVTSYKVSSWKGDVTSGPVESPTWLWLLNKEWSEGLAYLTVFCHFCHFLPDALGYVTGVLTSFTTSLSCLLPFFAFHALGIKGEMIVQVWDMQAFSWFVVQKQLWLHSKYYCSNLFDMSDSALNEEGQKFSLRVIPDFSNGEWGMKLLAKCCAALMWELTEWNLQVFAQWKL